MMTDYHLRWLVVVICFWLRLVQAQILQNGQVFTNGLAIFDSPAPNSVLHAGSSMSIAVDVSGDGKLSQPSFSATGFDTLNIFMVSSETNVNLTVTSDAGFLIQEQGSTVKHLNWPIPACIQPGSYNVTLYETAHISNMQYFSITPIPVTIQNSSPSGSCSSQNPLLAQPQVSSPFPENPFLNANVVNQPVGSITSPLGSSGTTSITSSAVSLQSYPAAVTVTLGPSGLQWPITIAAPQESGPIVVEPSGYVPSGTVTVTASMISTAVAAPLGTGDGTVTVVVTSTSTPTPVMVVLVSIDTETLTTTVSGQPSVITTTETVYSTTVAFMGMQDVNMNGPDYAGFLPINAESSAMHSFRDALSYTAACIYLVVLLILL